MKKTRRTKSLGMGQEGAHNFIINIFTKIKKISCYNHHIWYENETVCIIFRTAGVPSIESGVLSMHLFPDASPHRFISTVVLSSIPYNGRWLLHSCTWSHPPHPVLCWACNPPFHSSLCIVSAHTKGIGLRFAIRCTTDSVRFAPIKGYASLFDALHLWCILASQDGPKAVTSLMLQRSEA